MAAAAASRLTLPAIWAGSQPTGGAAGHGAAALHGAADRGTLQVWTAGFIANRHEVLAAAGLPPAASDIDILCSLFRRHGAETARRIEGPFAWILRDAKTGELCAARDRAGAWGIYYAQTGGRVLVGDRVRQVRPHLPSPGLNFRTLVAQMHGAAPLPGETCLAGIHALEPGSVLVASAAGLLIERYWRLEPQPPLQLASDREYADCFSELLFEVVEKYRASEPSALALSSGLDSTAVAAALHVSGAPITLLTCGMPEVPASDETEGAAAVAAHLGLPLQVVEADRLWPLSDEDGIRTLEEGPATYFRELWEGLFERLHQLGIRVMFTGASGDHLLGGTGVLVYPDLALSGRWRHLAAALRSHRQRSGKRLAPIVYGHLLRPLLRAYLPLRWKLARRRVPWLGRRYRHLARQVLPGGTERWRRQPGRRLRLQALGDRRLPYTLSLTATLAARHGIELRHPLTDHRLLQLAASLPLEQCLRAGLTKFVLRASMRGYLPTSILENPHRTSPLALFDRGLREREQGKVRSLITGMRAAELGLVDERELQRAYERYLQRGRGRQFWNTLKLEDWLRRYA